MTLEEILNNITILTNNCTTADATLQITLIGGAICTVFMMIAVILSIRDGQPKVVTVLCGFLALLGAAAIVISILGMTNESMQLEMTKINLYVKLNDVSIEDISKYFKLSDTINNDGQIYANITPVYEHSDEVRQILHSMEIV